MLHSEDADINLVIRQIIDLDLKAVRIKENVNRRTEAMLEKSKTKIAENEKLVIGEVSEQAELNYQVEIDKAKAERQDIIDSMECALGKVRLRYDEQKEKKAMEVLETLFGKT